MENWGTFATVAGTAAASLAGLLFVAVSIRTAVIARSQEQRNRAAQTLTLFVTALFITILLSIPGQSYRVLGAELVVLAILAGAGHLMLDRRAEVDPDLSPPSVQIWRRRSRAATRSFSPNPADARIRIPR